MNCSISKSDFSLLKNTMGPEENPEWNSSNWSVGLKLCTEAWMLSLLLALGNTALWTSALPEVLTLRDFTGPSTKIQHHFACLSVLSIPQRYFLPKKKKDKQNKNKVWERLVGRTSVWDEFRTIREKFLVDDSGSWQLWLCLNFKWDELMMKSPLHLFSGKSVQHPVWTPPFDQLGYHQPLTPTLWRNGILFYSSTLEATMRTKKPPSDPSTHLQPWTDFEKCVAAMLLHLDSTILRKTWVCLDHWGRNTGCCQAFKPGNIRDPEMTICGECVHPESHHPQ